nr:hypothetical protein [Tanacetum cinerariifolium]
PNDEALRKCILNGPYKPTTVLVQAIEATDDSPAIPEHTTFETPMNMSLENKAHFKAEKEAIHLILTRIGDKIYSTVDACQTAQEIWEAIERLQQATAYMGDTLVETHQTPIVDQPSTSKPHKKQQPRRKQRKEAEVSHDESKDEDHVPTPSSDPLPN